MEKSVWEGTEDCLFCGIIEKKIPSKIVHEDERAIAFEDVNPQAPIHLLVIPRKHISGLSTMQPKDDAILAHLFSVVSRLAREKGIVEDGYRTVINSGRGAGQAVFHLHVHLLSGRPFQWPPG
ncbi:MAG: histidine triad nucleotide-binding protein [Nitrospira sp.]|nr:histidine triad nucleotide-binding protein [Candidatus Manganitrophaceae bacterium]HIL34680.1 histidine triad nucleotide-binding protein [Candidatus Manganitrophaceae bacterium]